MYKIAYAQNGEVSGISRISDGAHIPIDVRNRDFKEFLVWNVTGGLDYETPCEPAGPSQWEIEAAADKARMEVLSAKDPSTLTSAEIQEIAHLGMKYILRKTEAELAG